MKVVFISTTSSKLDQLPIKDGQVIALSDTNAYYYDINNNRYKVGSIAFVSDLNTEGQIGILYVCSNPSGLYIYNGSEYSPVGSSNIPEFPNDNKNLGYTLFRKSSGLEWGNSYDVYCSGDARFTNSKYIGSIIKMGLEEHGSVRVNIIGEINMNYGPIVIPDIFSIDKDNLSITLDFHNCVFKTPYTLSNPVPIIDFNGFDTNNKLKSLCFEGLNLNQNDVPLYIPVIAQTYNLRSDVCIKDSILKLGSYSISSLFLIAGTSSGITQSIHFDNCIFMSCWESSDPDNFKTGTILSIYPSDIYETTCIFSNCKFLHKEDPEAPASDNAGKNYSYNIASYWENNNHVIMNGCIMSFNGTYIGNQWANILIAAKIQYAMSVGNNIYVDGKPA